MDSESPTAAAGPAQGAAPRAGRPRSERAHQAILAAAKELLIAEGFAGMRLEHIAARARVGKATIYRRWSSKEAIAEELLQQLAAPHIAVADSGHTRTELLAAVTNPMRAITHTEFGPVIRALLSALATEPSLRDPFRATVVHARRSEVVRVIKRGVARGDLRPDADVDMATDLLVGPVYFRLMFGGTLDDDFASSVVDAFLRGHAAHAQPAPAS